MVDMFPFPTVTDGKTEKQQIAELVSYLIQFKETLEFALTNISTENLSSALVNKLNELGTNIEKNKEERAEEVAQISNKTLTVSDVCNSDLLKSAIQTEVRENVKFNVNFNTGCLEYTTSKGEV